MGKGAGLPHMNSGGGTSQPIQLLIEIFFKHVAGKKKYLFDLLYVAKRNIPFTACRVSVEKSADNLTGVPSCVICHFPLVLLIFYLCL